MNIRNTAIQCVLGIVALSVAPSLPAQVLQAETLYLEFFEDQAAALKKYRGTMQVVEGVRGTRIDATGGDVAIHIPVGQRPNAIILLFPDPRQLEGIRNGAKFRFRCSLENFDYQIIHMQDCTVPGPNDSPATAPKGGRALSAVAMYREFKENENAALRKYGGTTQVFEGIRGTRIDTSFGTVAIHIPDGYTARALVLSFSDPQQLDGIEQGVNFRFKCTVEKFDYQYVHLNDCTVVRGD